MEDVGRWKMEDEWMRISINGSLRAPMKTNVMNHGKWTGYPAGLLPLIATTHIHSILDPSGAVCNPGDEDGHVMVRSKRANYRRRVWIPDSVITCS